MVLYRKHYFLKISFFWCSFVWVTKNKNSWHSVLKIDLNKMAVYIHNKWNFQFWIYYNSRLRSNLSIVACFSIVDCFFYCAILIQKGGQKKIKICDKIWQVSGNNKVYNSRTKLYFWNCMLHKINYYVKRHIHIKNPTSTEYFSFNHDSNIFYAFGLNSGESALIDHLLATIRSAMLSV